MVDSCRASTGSNNQLKAKKVRTPKSCDRCKSRKTKCIDPVPGPCRYCAHIGAECGVAQRPKQRPYYHVSEEEYRCSMQILQHFLPEEELNLVTLRAIAKDIKSGNSPKPIHNFKTDKADSEPLEGTVSNDSEPDTEEIGDLHEQLGCLMRDSLGEYRYVGAYSEIAFNAAVCSIKDPPSPELEESKIILPPKDDFPPVKPERVKLLEEVTSSDQPYLPPREYCDYYVARFFEEVHCIYWLFPIEQFHARLDDTYIRGSSEVSSSWLCSLYAIFALGAASGSNTISDGRARFDIKTSNDYLVLAKALVPSVHDEADIDSIRALTILSLALLTFKFRITSYLYMGTAMQIAFSLGLQHDQSPTTQSPVSRQVNRRIWWTLYIFDHEIASRCGSPCVSDERSLRIATPLPSEQVLNPGTNTPLGILSVSVSLSRLKRTIIQTIYPSSSSDSRKISFAAVTAHVSSLQSWQASMPSHLKWGVPVAPTHRRSIGILHLNYWNAMMLLTQPFLLYLVLRGNTVKNPKKSWFEKLGEICVDAAMNAAVVLKAMREEGSLSSLVTIDCTCALKVIMIYILVVAREDVDGGTGKGRWREAIEMIEEIVEVLESMEQVGFVNSIVGEIPQRLEKLGIKREVEDSVKVQQSMGQWSAFHGGDSYGSATANLQGMEGLGGDSFLVDMDLFMDMDLSPMQGSGDLFQTNLDFFSGVFGEYDGLQ